MDINYKWHRETLLVVATMLKALLISPSVDAEDTDLAAADPTADDPAAADPVDADPPPDVLKWLQLPPPLEVDDDASSALTMPGEELPSSAGRKAIAAAIAAQGDASEVRFTESQWQAFGLIGVRADHYVQVGEAYFGPSPSLLEQLVNFASLTLMSSVANELVCSKCLGDDTEQACIDGCCPKCGFHRLWSKGLRPTLFKDNGDGTEQLRDDVDPMWDEEVEWDTIKPGSDDNNHGQSDAELRHSVRGTLTDFLDAFETVQRNWLPHRFHTVQAKVSQHELEENITPAKLKTDSDWCAAHATCHVWIWKRPYSG